MTPTAVAVFNDLSRVNTKEAIPEREVERLIENLVQTLRSARRIRRDLAVLSDQALPRIEVSPGLTMAAFLERRAGRGKDLQRFILAMQNHAPHSKLASATLAAIGEEYRFRDRPAVGLGIAALNQWLSASFATAGWVEVPEVEVQRLWLEENGDLGSEAVGVPHVAGPEDVAHHSEFLRAMTLSDSVTGDELWRDRQALYPKVRFLPRVEQQLESLAKGSAALKQIKKRLDELQGATAEWEPSTHATPSWGSLVTPESEQRKRLCHFRDLDGVERCFDLHARFSPEPGRIHFRLDRAAGELVVAHIGRKLS
jgi:hypothetical protein